MKTLLEFINDKNSENIFFEMLENCPTIKDIFVSEMFDDDELCEKAMSSNKTGLQPWAKDEIIKSTPDFKNLDKKIDFIMDTYINPIKKSFENTLKRASVKDSKVLISVKTPESIESKVKRGTPLSKMTDILRASILVPSENDIDKVLKNMKKYFNLYEIDHKEKGTNKWGYFGTYHYDVDFNGVLCEVQIMPKTTFTYKNKGHEIYTKYRDLVKKNPEIENSPEYKKAIEYSKRIFLRGAGNKAVHL